jgi:hypothetical protein
MFKKIIVLFFLSFSVYGQVYQPPTVTLKPCTAKSGFVYMPDAQECTILKSTDGNYRETQCDYTILWNLKMDGVHIMLRNHQWGDYAYMTVRHPIAGEVGRFGQKIMFDDSKQEQEWIKTSYDAELAAGLVVRVHYFTKSTAQDIDAIFNWSFHKIVP